MFPSDPDWPTVTVVTRPGDLEPRWRDDAAVVGSAVFAAMRPDRLIPAWIGLLLLQLLGFIGHSAGIGGRMLPGDPAVAYERWRSGLPLFETSEASDPLGGLLHGLLLAAGGVIIVLLWSMLARMDAERLGRDRDVPMVAAVRWVIASWQRLVGAVLLPPVLAILLGVPAVLFALLARVPVLDVVVAVLWIVPLVPAFAGALIAVAWVIGLPFIVPAAACDGGDPVETTVRVASLLRRRCPRVISLLGVAGAAGILGWAVVSAVVVTTIDLASAGLAGDVFSLSWPSLATVETIPSDAEPGLATGIIGWWHGIIVSVAHGWIFGFAMLACGRILMVVRRSADRLPFDDLGEPAPV